ncbi:hypothetical protein E0H71_15805 [Rhizobium leguminosarum bv. viciae]|uniref:hypothetical protein n=1 Tax=Rhizobium leguminosarum TaxID=384 RepID=UPI00103A3114|nr:hypothetical protein [Rhizobium leguminosarum]NKK33416.1 hypothetical protein [Rhizobium leguminosarum bv. viciae]TCA52750.1 hypothetical protein E0H71_15805 [Rhizobium leguminosarum bv. viciae]
MTDEYHPVYKWRETWPGEGHQDFSGFDGEQSFGRIHLDNLISSRLGMWKWNATDVPWAREHLLPHSGWEATSREACRRVEEHYGKLKALHRRR